MNRSGISTRHFIDITRYIIVIGVLCIPTGETSVRWIETQTPLYRSFGRRAQASHIRVRTVPRERVNARRRSAFSKDEGEVAQHLASFRPWGKLLGAPRLPLTLFWSSFGSLQMKGNFAQPVLAAHRFISTYSAYSECKLNAISWIIDKSSTSLFLTNENLIIQNLILHFYVTITYWLLF